MKQKIAVIGTGYVGLVQAVGLCTLGHDVIGVDVDSNKVALLNAGELPLFEAGLYNPLNKFLQTHQLKFTKNYNEIDEVDLFFICVPTPQKENGEAELQYVWSVIESLSRLSSKKRILVIKSTVPVGTNATIQKKLKSLGLPFTVISNPEFLRQGTAFEDFMNPERIVLGYDDKDSLDKVKLVYSYFQDKIPFLETSWESSEMIKYAANSFLATKISFINEIAELVEKVGGDIEDVAVGIGLDSRIGQKFLKAGIGYGGSCFPKDVDALLASGKQMQVHLSILDAAQKVNTRARHRFVDKIIKYYQSTDVEKKIGILGLAFKGNTDDIRSSVALEVVKELIDNDFEIHVYDPQAMSLVRKLKLNNIYFYTSIEEVIINNPILALLTEWNEFTSAEAVKLYSSYSNTIFDAKNILSNSQINNATIISIGQYIHNTTSLYVPQ